MDATASDSRDGQRAIPRTKTADTDDGISLLIQPNGRNLPRYAMKTALSPMSALRPKADAISSRRKRSPKDMQPTFLAFWICPMMDGALPTN